MILLSFSVSGAALGEVLPCLHSSHNPDWSVGYKLEYFHRNLYVSLYCLKKKIYLFGGVGAEGQRERES